VAVHVQLSLGWGGADATASGAQGQLPGQELRDPLLQGQPEASPP
jgi:hypothetical protein